VPGILDALHASPAPTVAVSPIVGGEALRGPAADIMRSLGAEPSAAGVARHYAATWPDLVDVLVIDEADESDVPQIAAEGLRAHVTNTVIAEHSKRRRLAQEILELAGAL
jgi:LPPG:FO 2-phospho-L-lactate transferase